MKRILSVILLMSFFSFNFYNLAFGKEENLALTTETNTVNTEVGNIEKNIISENILNNKIKNISTSYKKLNKKEYKKTTVFKHYVPYEITLKNKNNTPILMTTKTEIEFITNEGSIIKSDSRRDIYNYTRKRDRGRHYALQVPGVILGTCISLGTFLLGTPVGYGVYKAMQYPTIKAARTNVNISHDLYSDHGLPLRFEPNVEYAVYFYLPKNKDPKNPTILKAINIKNVSINNELKEIEIPIMNTIPIVKEEEEEEEENIVPVNFKNERNESDINIDSKTEGEE